MAEKKYTAKTRTVTPRPRSERLRRLGGSAAAASSTITNVDGSAAVAQTSAGHTHANKDDLDRLSLSADDYLLIQDTTEKVKAKSGYADEAGHSASSDKAKEAEKAENAEQWDGHVFGDYLDQPVRKGDGVAFKSATISDDVKSPDFSSGIVGGTGWRAWLDAMGKSHLEIDNLMVRAKALFAELEVRKVTYAGGNINLSAAGSRIVKTVPLDDQKNKIGQETKKFLKLQDGSLVRIGGSLLAAGVTVRKNTVYTRCYLYADDGTMRTENWWKVGDQALCQTFNIKAGQYTGVANRYYWRLVCGVGSEMLDDGKWYDYVDLYSGTDGGGVQVDDKTLMGSAYVEGATLDLPKAEDVIVQVGSQTDNDRQSLIQLTVTGDKSPAIIMHNGIGSGPNPYSYHPVQTYSPKGTEVQASYFKVVSSGDAGVSQPVYCNRGAYDADAMYGYHDEVSYMGSLYVYKSTEVTSGKRPTDTKYWQKVVSAGRNAEYDVTKYAVSGEATTKDTTTAPEIYGSWSDVPQKVNSTYPYLWEQITHYDADGNAGTPYYVRVTGERGANGTSFTSRGKADYHVSNVEALQDVAEAPADGAVALIDDEDGIKVATWMEATDWVLTAPSNGDAYVYDGSVFVASNGAWVNMGAIQGAKGDTSYIHYAWADKDGTKASGNDANNIGFTTDKALSSGKAYLGVYSDFSATASKVPSDYAWTKIQGEAGINGLSAETYQLTTTQSIVNQSDKANADGTFGWIDLDKVTTTAFGYVGDTPIGGITVKVLSRPTNCNVEVSGATVKLTSVSSEEDSVGNLPTEDSVDVSIYVGGVRKATITWRLYFNRVGTFRKRIMGDVQTEVAERVKTEINENNEIVKDVSYAEFKKSAKDSISALKDTEAVLKGNGWTTNSYESVIDQTSKEINMSVKANYAGNLLKESNLTLKASTGHSDDYPHFVGQYKYNHTIAKGSKVTLTAKITKANAGETVYVNFHDGGKTEAFALAETTEAQTVSVTHTMAAAVDGMTKIDFNQNSEYSAPSNEVTVGWAVMLYGENSAVDEWKASSEEESSKFILKPKNAGIVTTDANGNTATIETSTDEEGTVKIGAKHIKMEGAVTANNGFKIDDNGYITTEGATINGIFLTRYASGRKQLFIDNRGLTYYADDEDGTVIWTLGKSGNVVKNQSLDHWDTIYLLERSGRIAIDAVICDKEENGSYYVVGKQYSIFMAGENSVNLSYDGFVTADDVSDNKSPASCKAIENGNYVQGNAYGMAVMQSTDGKYLQTVETYNNGKRISNSTYQSTTVTIVNT